MKEKLKRKKFIWIMGNKITVLGSKKMAAMELNAIKARRNGFRVSYIFDATTTLEPKIIRYEYIRKLDDREMRSRETELRGILKRKGWDEDESI